MMEYTLFAAGGWILVCALLYVAGKCLSRHYATSVNLWWGLLLASFIPFIPVELSGVAAAIPESLFVFAPGSTKLQGPFLTHEVAGVDWLKLMTRMVVFTYVAGLLVCLYRLGKQSYSLYQLLALAKPLKIDSVSSPTFVLPVNLSPFVVGLVEPKVFLPRDFLTLSAQEREVLLLHELTHIQLRDHIAVTIWRILAVVAWFNPFIAKMEGAFVKAMEYRCDAVTVTKHQLDPILYVRSLLNSLKRSVAQSQELKLAINFASSALSLADYKLRFKMASSGARQTSGKLLSLAVVSVFAMLALVKLNVATFFTVSDGIWQYPVAIPEVTSPYGNISEVRAFKSHGGIDLRGAVGEPVRAVRSGVVLVADASTLAKNYGNVVLIDHGNGYRSLYAHLSKTAVGPGDTVASGGKIGEIGATGKVTGPHLHLEILHHEQRLDPLTLLGN